MAIRENRGPRLRFGRVGSPQQRAQEAEDLLCEARLAGVVKDYRRVYYSGGQVFWEVDVLTRSIEPGGGGVVEASLELTTHQIWAFIEGTWAAAIWANQS